MTSIVEENMHAKLFTKTNFDMCAVAWQAVILGVKIIKIPCRSRSRAHFTHSIYKCIVMKPMMVNFFAVSLHFPVT